MAEMQLKEDASSFLRPASPERKYINTLANIPETTPGPNAFAQQAARMDKHRLDGNAFYQQEVQRRMATPPTLSHPASRASASSDPSSPPRLSTSTTMSPFINAGKELKQSSPPLKLVPSQADLAEPTLRGIIEERQEQLQHDKSGSEDERIPVFIPTPKIACSDFAKPTTTPKKRAEDTATSESSLKTPKRGFLSRLKLTTNLRGISSPSPSTIDDDPKIEQAETMAVKAQAVLGTSPSKKARTSLGSSTSKGNLPRSPSKRKGFFSRKNSGLADVHESTASLLHSSAEVEKPPLTASSVTKTPQTAISDPTHYSYLNKRIISQSQSDQGGENEKPSKQCAVTRSQSLKYFDHSMPPTPPAKNTPPGEKGKKDNALNKSSTRLPFHDEQTSPSKQPEGMVSISGRVSPTRFGSYGHKEMPTLVTKPSVYSLHASVVPNMSEANTFEEMKARIDGLGLEGFSISSDNVKGSKLGPVYSPSMYSSEWNERPTTVLIGSSPQMEQDTKSPNCQSTHTKESSSSGGEIPIYYPGLAKDPSVSSITKLRETPSHKHHHSDGYLDSRLPWHGCTHSRDHSNGNSPRPSIDSALFAQHIDTDGSGKRYDSSSSFNNPSAAPSPLHLPATVFTPPSRIASKLRLAQQKDGNFGDSTKTAVDAFGVQARSRSDSTSPTKRKGVFDNAPSLPARTSQNRSCSPSVQNSDNASALETDCDVDPQKAHPKEDSSTDKLDQMIEILNRLNTRNNEISTMRDEMRATNERLDQRLAAVESLHRASPAPSYALEEGLDNTKAEDDSTGIRVPTDVAHEFYRHHEQVRIAMSGHANGSDQTDSHTIAELKETNKRLLEMVGGFAEKIQALEKRNGGQN